MKQQIYSQIWGGNPRGHTGVVFQVTDRCNYRCTHCYQEHTDKEELSFDQVKDILEQIADMGVMFLTLIGGEFFMRRDADEILKLASALNFSIRLKTTGHFIHERRADLIAQCKPIDVHLSVYGSKPHLHEHITKQAGSWKKTIEAAKRLIKRQVPVKLTVPLSESSAPDVANISQLAEELGARVSYDPKISGMQTADQQPVALRMGWTSVKEFYKNKVDDIPIAGDKIRTLDSHPCRAGRGVAITPQGQVRPCLLLPISCGNLQENSLREIWFDSQGLKDIRSIKYAHISECNVCPVRPYCVRCHAMAYLEQGKMRGPSLEACRHAVAVRDSLREAGKIAASETDMPPTWGRVRLDGQHHLTNATLGKRPSALRVI